MTSTYFCEACLHRQQAASRCVECDAEDLVDLEALTGDERQEFEQHLRGRAQKRRRWFIFAMEAAAIAICAGVLYVGLTVATGLGGAAASWGARILALGLLVACWIAIPRVYDRYLRGRAAAILVEWGATSEDG